MKGNALKEIAGGLGYLWDVSSELIPRETVDAPSMEVFKSGLDGVFSNLI